MLPPLPAQTNGGSKPPPYDVFVKGVFIARVPSNKVLGIFQKSPIFRKVRFLYMKATGIVRRIDDLGRVVIPKEIRRTMRIREGDPSHTTLTPIDKFCLAIHSVVERMQL